MASSFQKVTEVSNTIKDKFYDNMKSVDVYLQLYEESNRKGKHESINKVPKLSN